MLYMTATCAPSNGTFRIGGQSVSPLVVEGLRLITSNTG